MAAGSTYTPIATTTLGSAAASYTFSSIPSTYTDLVLVTSAAGTAGADMRLQFNSDTATNYSRTYLSGNGTSAFSGRATATASAGITAYGTLTATLGGTNNIAQIMNYSNSTTYKTVLARSNDAGAGTDAIVSMWRSTAAITSINISVSTGTFSTGSTFTLYGIAAA